MRSESYHDGYKAGHRDGFQRFEKRNFELATACASDTTASEYADGYARGYDAGIATREYHVRKHGEVINFRNPAHRARVLEGR
jgi:hypothetical protein